MVRLTSIESYNRLKEEGRIGEMQEEVYKTLTEKGSGMTDREIASALGHSDPNKVRPRRFELADMGLVEAVDRRECSITGRTAIAWTPTKAKPIKRKVGLQPKEMNKIKNLLAKADKKQLKKIEEWIDKRHSPS